MKNLSYIAKNKILTATISFIMAAVIAAAVAASIIVVNANKNAVLTKIEVVSYNAKTSYIEGERLDISGLEV